MRRRIIPIANGFLALGLLAGCAATSSDELDIASVRMYGSSLPDEQILSAVDIAINEPSVWRELDQHPHEIVEVRLADNGADIVVIARFDETLSPEAWPPDEPVCAIGGHTEQITGIVSIVRPWEDRLMAFSPEWQSDDGNGYVTCVG
jgi:hypothetical protein